MDFLCKYFKHGEDNAHFSFMSKRRLRNAGHTQSFLPIMFFVHFSPLPREKKPEHKGFSDWSHQSSFFFIFLFFSIIAGFSRSQSRFPISLSFLLSLCLSHAAQIHTCTEADAHKHTQKQRHYNVAAANGGAQIAHLYCYIILFVFTFHSLLSFSAFLLRCLCASARTASVRCVHLFPILIVLSLVILSPVPHLSAIIKDPVASYVAPVERRVRISATHLATAPRNYGL